MKKEVGERLGAMLAVWAERHRLPDTRAKEILEDILKAGRELDYIWWEDFSSRLAACIQMALKGLPEGLAFSQRLVAMGFIQGGLKIIGWGFPKDLPSYRVYIKI